MLFLLHGGGSGINPIICKSKGGHFTDVYFGVANCFNKHYNIINLKGNQPFWTLISKITICTEQINSIQIARIHLTYFKALEIIICYLLTAALIASTHSQWIGYLCK